MRTTLPAFSLGDALSATSRRVDSVGLTNVPLSVFVGASFDITVAPCHARIENHAIVPNRKQSSVRNSARQTAAVVPYRVVVLYLRDTTNITQSETATQYTPKRWNTSVPTRKAM